LEHGVTTVRNLGDEHHWITDLRRQIEDGTLEGPRLFVSGPLFTTAGGHPIVTFGADPNSDLVRVPSTPEEARSMVHELAVGHDRVDLIKVVQDRGGPRQALEPIPPDILKAIVTEAHANRLPVVAHWGTFADLDELLAAEVDGLEHVDSRDLLDGWPEDLLSELVERDVPITATLTVSEAALPPDVMPDVIATLQQRVREFRDAGGRIVVGSDAARPGVLLGSGLHRELELLVASGMTPREAMRAATVDAAQVLGTDHLGIIAAGRAADLLVIDGDPTSDVAVAREPLLVFRDGRMVVDRRPKN
jgi:enamidase